MSHEPLIYQGDCEELLKNIPINSIHVTFLDPPFNQGKQYENHDDKSSVVMYWAWMKNICTLLSDVTVDGGALYFMQREKNIKKILETLSETGWIAQNIIVWKKKTSAVPQANRFSKQYQIIVFATKGENPLVFNHLRIDLPLSPGQKIPRENGVLVTDVWDDILEMTSGFYAGDEALRDQATNERLHEQQSPIALLLRMILSSSRIDDKILDPFAGSGTTSVVATQIGRDSISIENSHDLCTLIKQRLSMQRKIDDVERFRDYYRHTENLGGIWKSTHERKGIGSLLNFIR